ncbi:hypothetical protein Tco_0736686 [Tanacetum coccineum]
METIESSNTCNIAIGFKPLVNTKTLLKEGVVNSYGRENTPKRYQELKWQRVLEGIVSVSADELYNVRKIISQYILEILILGDKSHDEMMNDSFSESRIVHLFLLLVVSVLYLEYKHLLIMETKEFIKVMILRSRTYLEDFSEYFHINSVSFLINLEPVSGRVFLVDGEPKLLHIYLWNICSDEESGIAGSKSKSIDVLSCSVPGQDVASLIRRLDSKNSIRCLDQKVDTSYPTGGYGVSGDQSEQNTV